jgi:hypothetical protein
MRAKEFTLDEARVGTVTYSGMRFIVDDHAILRAAERDVDPHAVDRCLQLLAAKPDLVSGIDSGQQFWVYDSNQNIALGMRRFKQDQPEFQLKTVLDRRPQTPGLVVTV